jgi:hypothetical protein
MCLAPTVVAMESLGTKGYGVMTFMAECFWPAVTAQKVADAGERVRQASHAISCDDGFARYLGSILVPADEIALFLLEAASIDAATELAQQAVIRLNGSSKSCGWVPSSKAAATTPSSSKELR